jgi:hypothetical protein
MHPFDMELENTVITEPGILVLRAKTLLYIIICKIVHLIWGVCILLRV